MEFLISVLYQLINPTIYCVVGFIKGFLLIHTTPVTSPSS